MFRIFFVIFILLFGATLVFREKELLFQIISNFKSEDATGSSAETQIQETDPKLNISKSHLDQKNFHTHLEADLIELKKKYDPRLFKVKKIMWISRDVEIKSESLNKVKTIQIEPSSNLNLEVEVFSQSDNETKTIITQFSYTDLNTKNKVHEFSRMYQLSNDNKNEGKKKPD